MLFYLYGPDFFRRTKKLNEIVNKYKDKYNGNSDILRVDLGEDADQWKDIIDFISQPSMFNSSKLAIVDNPTSYNKKAWIENIKKYLDNKDIFILFNEENKKPKKAFSFLLKKPVIFQNFEELSGPSMSSFINKEAKERGLRLESEVVSLFLSYLDQKKEKSAIVVNELEKLYLANLSQPIKVANLINIVDWPSTEQLFITVRRFLQTKDEKKKVIIMDRLLSDGDDPAYVFNMIAYQSKGSKALEMADMDVMIKSGKIDYESAILKLVL